MTAVYPNKLYEFLIFLQLDRDRGQDKEKALVIDIGDDKTEGFRDRVLSSFYSISSTIPDLADAIMAVQSWNSIILSPAYTASGWG